MVVASEENGPYSRLHNYVKLTASLSGLSCDVYHFCFGIFKLPHGEWAKLSPFQHHHFPMQRLYKKFGSCVGPSISVIGGQTQFSGGWLCIVSCKHQSNTDQQQIAYN